MRRIYLRFTYLLTYLPIYICEQSEPHTDVRFVRSCVEKRLLDLRTFGRLHPVHWVVATGTDWSALLVLHAVLVG